MADDPHKRERILEWLRSSKAWKPVRIITPRAIKTRVQRIIASGRQGSIDLGDGAQLKYDLDDPYWPSTARNIRSYEPEIWDVVDRFISPHTLFIDCGANIGLWSCTAAAKIKNKDQVIAVEPSDSILPMLYQNHALNGENFTILDKAVWSVPDKTKSFMVHKSHVSSSLVDQASSKTPLRRISVKTASIDNIVENALAKSSNVTDVIIKLDVEGVEREAMEGTKATLAKHNTLIIYEDHGKDPLSKTTEHFLKQGLHIYYIDAGTHIVQPIRQAKDMCAIKTDICKGYNFIACKPGSKFDDEFSQLCGKSIAIPKRYTQRLKFSPNRNSPHTQRSARLDL